MISVDKSKGDFWMSFLAPQGFLPNINLEAVKNLL